MWNWNVNFLLWKLVCWQIKPLSVRYGTGVSGSDHDMEGRIVTVEFDSFYLISTYVPNSGDGLKRLVLLKSCSILVLHLTYSCFRQFDKCFGFQVIQDWRMGSNPQQLHQSMKLFFELLSTYCICFFLQRPQWLCSHLQELEKSKPVVLTGDLNCAHEEIDIYNPAVTN